MRQLERRAYVWQVDELVEAGRFKKFPDKGLIAVLVPEVKITSIRKQKIRKKFKGKDGKEYHRDYLREYTAVSVYRRGEALHPILRKTSEGEKEELKALSEEELRKKGIILRGGEFLLPVVMKIEGGLPAGARQRIRHIPGSLVERKGRGFILAGDTKILAVFADRINNIIKSLLEFTPPTHDFIENVSREYSQILELSERSKSRLMKLARDETALARQGKFWEIAAHSGAALGAILEERARKYQMAVNSWTLGVKWRDFYEETRQKFEYAYERIGKLAMRLEEFRMRGETLESKRKPLADELRGIYLYLINAEGSYFTPFCERVRSKEFQALNEVLLWATEGKWEKVERAAKVAQAKIEVIAKGETPTLIEIQRGKESFSLRE